MQFDCVGKADVIKGYWNSKNILCNHIFFRHNQEIIILKSFKIHNNVWHFLSKF